MAKSFSFDDCPSVFARLDGKSVGFEAFEDVNNFTHMRGWDPIGVEDMTVSRVRANKNFRCSGLSSISSGLEAHRDARVCWYLLKGITTTHMVEGSSLRRNV
jgi:hypothetical protein